MVLSSFLSPGLGQALGAIGALGLFAITGFTCGGSASNTTSTPTLAPIMATGPASTSNTSFRQAANDKKCPAR